MEVKTIGVIGADAMGRGIAYLSLAGGYRTVLEDVSPTMLEQGTAYIKQAIEAAMAGGMLTLDQRDAALANFSTLNRADELCREADLLIETVPEEMEVKLEIFTIFDKFAKPNAILASYTASLSITEMAAITFRTEDCVGMRFFDPVLTSKRLEIVRGLETSDATVATCMAVGCRMDKDVVEVRESPEFITSPGTNGGTRAKGRSR
jgi:3-hydroxybutyryl-CoA dehydrogenase